MGPLPLLTFITPSTLQLLLSLALFGCAIPTAVGPTIPVMFEVYRKKNADQLPQRVVNLLVSAYCTCFPLGNLIGNVVSGFVAPHATFRWSTGTVALLYIIQSVSCCVYCTGVLRMKRVDVEEPVVLEFNHDSTV